MLIKINELIQHLNININGILHIGAHECEELNDYNNEVFNYLILSGNDLWGTFSNWDDQKFKKNPFFLIKKSISKDYISDDVTDILESVSVASVDKITALLYQVIQNERQE